MRDLLMRILTAAEASTALILDGPYFDPERVQSDDRGLFYTYPEADCIHLEYPAKLSGYLSLRDILRRWGVSHNTLPARWCGLRSGESGIMQTNLRVTGWLKVFTPLLDNLHPLKLLLDTNSGQTN